MSIPTPDQGPPPVPAAAIEDLVFVAFNSQVIALDRYTGQNVWKWKSPQGTGFVAMLLDGDRLVVSIQGYTYCIDPILGTEIWRNPLSGLGLGVPSLASVRGQSSTSSAMEVHQQQQQQAAAAAGS
jgi:outer membrane protein assembly factor BamB